MTRGWAQRWEGARADALGAGVLLVVCGSEVAIDAVRHPSASELPVGVDIALVVVLTTAIAGRRRAPLASCAIAMAGVAVLVSTWSGTPMLNAPQLLLFVAPYGVAAYAGRTRALIGLAFSVAAVITISVVTSGPDPSVAFAPSACTVSWAAGRLMRSRRRTALELERTIALIDAEREGRELLAVAEQRTRIAQELQALVAQSVSAMIVQARAAGRLVEQGARGADAAMETVEATGREALTEMRRILGVLRHTEDAPDLAPQPGIGQVAALVEHARTARAAVTLEVVGAPGPLPASVDLGVYRVLQDALSSAAETGDPAIDIVLRFEERDVAVELTSRAAHLGWPTLAMRERVALCQGTIDVQPVTSGGECLTMRLPRAFDEVPA